MFCIMGYPQVQGKMPTELGVFSVSPLTRGDKGQEKGENVPENSTALVGYNTVKKGKDSESSGVRMINGHVHKDCRTMNEAPMVTEDSKAASTRKGVPGNSICKDPEDVPENSVCKDPEDFKESKAIKEGTKALDKTCNDSCNKEIDKSKSFSDVQKECIDKGPQNCRTPIGALKGSHNNVSEEKDAVSKRISYVLLLGE